MTVYTLPELPYDYAALEPHISGRIMELHHSKHHANYVAGANAALEKLAAARESGDFAAINLWEKNLAFNLAPRAPRVSSAPPSMSSSAPLSRSRRSSPPPPWACRAPAGPSSRGTPSASAS